MDAFSALLFDLAAFLYLAAFAATLPAIRRGKEGLSGFCSRLTLSLLAAGFLAQCAALAARGVALGQCPIVSRGDLYEIVAWSAVVVYGISGAGTRTNLLGFFTSGLAAILSLFALFSGSEAEFPKVPPIVLAHAWLSLLSYGAYALAALLGAMYWIQMRGLYRRRWAGIFALLPSLAELERSAGRLLCAAFFIYTTALVLGAFWMTEAGRILPAAKIVLALLLWVCAAAACLLRLTHRLYGRRVAAAAIVLFALALLALVPIGERHGASVGAIMETPLDEGR